MKSERDLAVIVLSVRAPPELRGAVESLQRQTPLPEIVVVNSGGGDPKAVIGGVDGNVRVVTRSDRLLPGAARNLGIEASHARWIAFMASDHIATDGWVAARLEAHRRGNLVVGSAVINSHPKNLLALARDVSLLVRRLPGVPPEEALPYGSELRARRIRAVREVQGRSSNRRGHRLQ